MISTRVYSYFVCINEGDTSYASEVAKVQFKDFIRKFDF